jgi:hypothetical protein
VWGDLCGVSWQWYCVGGQAAAGPLSVAGGRLWGCACSSLHIPFRAVMSLWTYS